ncbi:MAG: cation-translocating P-type ATPase [Kiritimatiellae bacterium]|nr:cation-translocating P-type ATPase [Kiritimatiellia bacterium]
MTENLNPWELDVPAALAQWHSDSRTGLSAAEAERRLREHGPNQLQEQPGAGPWTRFFAQFKDVMIGVLLGAAVVAGALGEWVDTGAIAGIVLLNAVLGFLQEHRAERALAALRRMASPNSRVLRDGRLQNVPSRDLVPGDVVELEAGDHVPADARLISGTAGFATQEASLTGESAPVNKLAEGSLSATTPLAERANMLYMGTAVVAGKGRALIAATGMFTELGHIAGMIQSIGAEPTPLQRKLAVFGRMLIKIVIVLVILVFVLTLARTGWQADQMAAIFLTAVSLAVAAIPEGLPAVVTLALALGVQRMVRRNALIRKLPSVESLGCATVICTDKTGTLTRNEMTVKAIYAGGRLYDVAGAGYQPVGVLRDGAAEIVPSEHGALLNALTCAALCNSATLEHTHSAWRVVGDPTEGALLTAAAKAGLERDALERAWPLAAELPFDSTRKRMTMIRQQAGGQRMAFVKGAPDIMLTRCQLDQPARDAVLAVNASLTARGLRVLAVAQRDLTSASVGTDGESVERDLTFLGLLAMIDPPRPEAREAIARCRTAGIRAVMITGDDPGTAAAIGRDLGMLQPGDRALTGGELDRLGDAALVETVAHTPVYARVSPEHKLRIVRAWKRLGQVVAMTGDGVNDAPALKEADIGVAMGITGTDVTKEVADMVVTDDNFASIVAAVEEGRGIYANIQKFIRYLLSCNAGEIIVMLGAALGGLPAPLLPIHILWVNLVTDGLPALALGVEPSDPDIMRHPPRDPEELVVNRSTGLRLLLQGGFIALCTLMAFAYVLYVEHGSRAAGLPAARTAAFLVLSLAQLVHAFNCRHETASLFKLGLWSNGKLVLAVGVSLALQFAVVSIPLLQRFFRTVSLSASDWLMAVVCASLPLWLMEAAKWWRRRNLG